jgi:hypothetical protein
MNTTQTNNDLDASFVDNPIADTSLLVIDDCGEWGW